MINRMPKFFRMVLLAAGMLAVPLAPAQTSSGPGSVLGSGADSFDELVNQDVASGYYSAAEGEKLKAQVDTSLQNITDSLEKAQTAMQKTESLAQSGNQLTLNQLGSLVNNSGQANLGGTPEEIQEQAKAIYGAAHLQLELTQATMDNIQPAIQTATNEISNVLNARAALIQSNPNISSAVKHNATKEATQVQDVADHSIEKGFSTLTAKLQTAQATLDNNKSQIISNIETTITTQVAAQGSDPSKWTKPTPPAKTPPPANTNNTPSNTAAQTPQGSTAPPSTPAKPSTSGGTTSLKGMVPSNQSDPALSATRNTNNGQGTPSNTGGNSSAAKNSSANNGTPSNAISSANQTSQAATQTASQVAKPPSKPPAQKPPTPPAQPKVTQQDLLNAMNKKPNIPNTPIAKPPSPAPPGAPKDDTAVALLDKPSNNPSGNGKAVIKGAPPSNSADSALAPNNSANPKTPLGLTDGQNGQGDRSQNQTDQSQNQTDQQQNQNDQTQNTATQSSNGTNGAGSSAASAAANAASSAADAGVATANASSASVDASGAAADASSAGQAASQSSSAKATIIPVSPNNPLAEAQNDPGLQANSNNPNYNPNQPANNAPGGTSDTEANAYAQTNPANATSNTGTLTYQNNGDPGGFVPPNAPAAPPDNSAAPPDASAAATSAAAAANAAANSVSSSSQPSITDIEAQIANQLKPGNAGHLVEGDEEMEGTTDATSSIQMPAISNLDLSVEFGDTLQVATLASIYAGYVVTPGQNGSSVIVGGTTQVATPSSLMTAPSLQVSTPGAAMTSPSMQVQFPSSVMTDPSMQVQFPSAVLVIPSNQIVFPSRLMLGLDLQPALCGQ